VPYDEELKGKFVAALRKKLFQRHTSFLSNPLLLSIMLLTYGQSASIPNKVNVFYNQAYEALFERHDALKGGYQRHRRTDLDIQDFARVFSGFSLQTYERHELEFSQTEALALLKKSAKLVAIEFDGADYLKDVLESVCLLCQDGLQIVFSHRSFQEYFAARFIAEADAKRQQALVDRYARNILSDNVLYLLYEMRPDLVESVYLIPRLDELFQRLGVQQKLTSAHHLQALQLAFTNLVVQPDGVRASFRNEDLWLPAHFAVIACGHLVDPPFDADMFDDTSVWTKYCDDGKALTVDSESITLKSGLYKDIARSNGFLSHAAFTAVFRIRKHLKAKAAKIHESLDKILGIE
jgi:hypothetical protein